MKIHSKAWSLLLAGVAFTMRCANATEDLPPAPDPAFAAGFATLKQATGFIEQPVNLTQAGWRPDLQLWVGVKTVTGEKQTIYFVQLTTLPPPPTNAAGAPWQPALRTNHWDWSGTNKTAASRKAQYVTPLYPVRVRVFDQAGQQLTEGQTQMAWGMLTNGLLDMCRFSVQFLPRETKSEPALTLSTVSLGGKKLAARPGEGIKTSAPPTTATQKLSEAENDDLMRSVGGSFLWMMSMLGDLRTMPALKELWEQSHCAYRLPSLWNMATSLVTGLSLSLEPRLTEVTLTNAPAAGRAGPLYRLPVDLKSDQRHLTRAEIIVGPAHGAEMLLAGICSLRAAHPTKPGQELLAQVLATGTGRETATKGTLNR